MKRLFVIAYLITINISGIAQSSSKITPLGIGDKVPEIFLNKIINYNKSNTKLSDYKNQLLILDFWQIRCASCIAAFPKITSLQDKFRDKITIMPVGFAGMKENEIELLFQKRKEANNPINIPSAVVYTGNPPNKIWDYWQKMFSIQGFPSLAWINNGILIGLTDASALTKQNIQDILDGRLTKFTDYKIPSIINGREGYFINNKGYGSTMVPYIDSIVSANAFDLSTDRSIHFWNINKPVPYHYEEAYRNDIKDEFQFPTKKRIVLSGGLDQTFYKDWSDVKDADNWTIDAFKKNNLFSYELLLPKKYTKEQAYRFMQQDIDRYLGLESRMVNRRIKCLALSTPTTTNYYPEKEYALDTLIQSPGNLQSVNVGTLVQILNQVIKTIVVDLTGYDPSVHFNIDLTGIQNSVQLIKKLRAAGLNLIESDQNIDCIEIKGKWPVNHSNYTSSADDIVKEACATATAEKKNIFIIFHPLTYCINCRYMNEAMEDSICKNSLENNYIIRHLITKQSEKQDTPGALKLLKKYNGSSFPFWIILNEKGTLLADSRMNGKNIGCPYTEEEVAYFVEVLKKTSKLTDEELFAITKRFRMIEQKF